MVTTFYYDNIYLRSNLFNILSFLVILRFQFYRFVELAIRQCKSSGIDCKVHGLTMVGRMRTDEDDLAATFTFLASDNEEDEEERTSTQVSEWL